MEQNGLINKFLASQKQEDFDELLDYYRNKETAADIGILADAYYMQAWVYMQKAIELHNKYLDMSKENKDFWYNKRSRQLIKLQSRIGINHENIDKYKNLLREYPDDTEIYAALALSYKLAHQYDEAFEVVKAGLKFDNKHYMLNSYAGDICKALGKYDEAIKYWDMAGDEFVNCLYSKAFLYAELGQKENAVTAWEQVISFFEKKDLKYETEKAKKEFEKYKNSINF